MNLSRQLVDDEEGFRPHPTVVEQPNNVAVALMQKIYKATKFRQNKYQIEDNPDQGDETEDTSHMVSLPGLPEVEFPGF